MEIFLRSLNTSESETVIYVNNEKQYNLRPLLNGEL